MYQSWARRQTEMLHHLKMLHAVLLNCTSCDCLQSISHNFFCLYIIATLKLKLQNPDPSKSAKLDLYKAAEILDEDIAQRCTSGQMIGLDGNHVVQMQSVKEIGWIQLILTLKCTVEVGLGMKLSFVEDVQKSCHVTGSHVLQWLNLLNPCTWLEWPLLKKEEAAESCCNSNLVGRFRMVLSSRYLWPRFPHVDPCGAQVFPGMAHGSEDVLELSSKSYKSQPSASRDRHIVNVHWTLNMAASTLQTDFLVGA